MAVRISRHKLAEYAATAIAEKRPFIEQLAAYLVSTKRTKEALLIVRDIESALVNRGIVIADVATARELSGQLQQAVNEFMSSKFNDSQIYLRTAIEPSLIGGLRLRVKGQELDNTVRRRLTTLKASKV